MNEQFSASNEPVDPFTPGQDLRIEAQELAKKGIYSLNDVRGHHVADGEWEPYQDPDDPMPFELRARWASVMLDFPPDGGPFMACAAMAHRARMLRTGAPYWNPEADEWHALGFTPELYLLLHQSISDRRERRRAALGQRVARRVPGAEEDFESFMASDGLISGKPLGFRWGSLRPSDWADLPGMLLTHRPSHAISTILERHGESAY